MNSLIEMKKEKLKELRKTLSVGGVSLGSWLQIPDASVAEIMGDAGYDWIAIDCEHGIFASESVVNICRAIELQGSLPFVRLPNWEKASCKLALEAGAVGIIIPMLENADDLERAIANCQWPPNGQRGIGFSRSNLFGKYFNDNRQIAEDPFVVAMIENKHAVEDIENILSTEGLDAIFVGPYDLSASLGCLGDFSSSVFKEALNRIITSAQKFSIPAGVHVVEPDLSDLKEKIEAGFRFNAYSIDTVFIREISRRPEI